MRFIKLNRAAPTVQPAMAEPLIAPPVGGTVTPLNNEVWLNMDMCAAMYKAKSGTAVLTVLKFAVLDKDEEPFWVACAETPEELLQRLQA